jgi:hypothetical protein
MDFDFFQRQINRLSETFGSNQYKSERLKLIWKEVNNFSDSWLIRVVDDFVGGSRQAPLVAEFREKAIEERERIYRIQKAQQTKEAEEFMSAYSGEDIKTICGQIRDRLNGKMTDNHFESFKKMITPPVESLPRCSRCADTNVYWDGAGMTLCGCKKKN